MKKFVFPIAIILSIFFAACEIKDTASEREKCKKEALKMTTIGIAQCGSYYTPGSEDYELCVDLLLIVLIDSYEMCKSENDGFALR